MAYRSIDKVNTDVLILGSGIAGLLLAQQLAQKSLRVTLACKETLLDSNTSKAQGGLAAVSADSAFDNPSLHLQDTLSSGAGLTDAAVAREIVYGGARLIENLTALGVNFDRNGKVLDLALEGGHSRARVLHSKDASGKAIAVALAEAVQQNPNITVIEWAFATDLLTSDGTCTGCTILKDGQTIQIFARHTVLATGGLGQVFSRTTNPAVATGDGIAMAYRAGARLVDMEFVQFHPTALAVPGAPAALISEAVRGAGAHLLDEQGRRFAFDFHKDGELATRDIVARAIYTTMVERQLPCVWLDMRTIGTDKIEQKFPNIVASCRSFGIDPLERTVPISPAAHYFMGGIQSDANGATSVANLYAIGECASTGLHGANRLASNSLLEGGVMALRLADLLTNHAMPSRRASEVHELFDMKPPLAMPRQLDDFRHKMFESAGLTRSEEKLNSLINSLPETLEYRVAGDRQSAEFANIALLGWLIARAAVERRESRGSHWRTDYPSKNDAAFQRRLCLSRFEMLWQPVATEPLPRANSKAFIA